jgi:hypothetical protein
VFAGNVVEHEGNPVNWNGVFSGPDVVDDQVLLHGDSLYDKTVTELLLLDLSNNGQILMMVGLSGPENWRGLVLATPTATYSADFDGDGDVDSDDLDEWQTAYGVNATADADGDGDSDGRDFLQWQRQYGSGVEPPVDIKAVPEPGTATILLIASLCGLFRRGGLSS